MRGIRHPHHPRLRPAFFRPPRDSMLPQPRRSAWPPPPTPPDSGANNPSTQVKGLRDSLISLAGLAAVEPSKPFPRSGPKLLPLNSTSLVSPTSSVLVRTPPPHLRRDSRSSITTSAPDIEKKTRRHDSHSELESGVMEIRLSRATHVPGACEPKCAAHNPRDNTVQKDKSSEDSGISNA
jgi:hypothetical protein